MNNRRNFGNQPADRWTEPREDFRNQDRSRSDRRRDDNPESDRFYQAENEGFNYRRNRPFEEGRFTSRFQNTSEERGFGGGGNFGGAQNYGRSPQYGGSNQSSGGGNFSGSPSDYGAGGSGGNYAGGYYGSSGSYGGGSDYRGGSSYAGGGNYSGGPGGAYGNDPMPAADDSNQGSFHGRTGYRSNYQAITNEFDAVMEDPASSTNYTYGGRQHARTYRDYSLDDNYGDMQGRDSHFNNYDGYTGNTPASRWDQDDRNRHHHQTWIERATDTARSWFGREENRERDTRW